MALSILTFLTACAQDKSKGRLTTGGEHAGADADAEGNGEARWGRFRTGRAREAMKVVMFASRWRVVALRSRFRRRMTVWPSRISSRMRSKMRTPASTMPMVI